jgi:hypothetical protein
VTEPASKKIGCWKPVRFLGEFRRRKMNPQEYQSLQVSRWDSRVSVSSFGNVLISAIIVGFALLMITIFASFALITKNIIK